MISSGDWADFRENIARQLARFPPPPDSDATPATPEEEEEE